MKEPQIKNSKGPNPEAISGIPGATFRDRTRSKDSWIGDFTRLGHKGVENQTEKNLETKGESGLCSILGSKKIPVTPSQAIRTL